MADQPRRPWEPLRPATPSPGHFGRLTKYSPLQTGWPCRHCEHPLGYVRNQATGQPSTVLACCNCDNPKGTTPA
jgi:hypothetical protein